MQKTLEADFILCTPGYLLLQNWTCPVLPRSTNQTNGDFTKESINESKSPDDNPTFQPAFTGHPCGVKCWIVGPPRSVTQHYVQRFWLEFD